MPHSKTKKPARSIWRRKRFWIIAAALGVFAVLPSCSGARVLMQTAPSKPNSDAAKPVMTSATKRDWEAKVPTIKTAFEKDVYGPIPQDLSLELVSSRELGDLHFEGTATLEFHQYRILKAKADTARELNLVILTPHNVSETVPIIMMQNFCPNHYVIPHPSVPRPKNINFDCSGDGLMANIFGYFFGRYITTPPITDIMERGYAIAVMYPSEFIPDSRDAGQAVLDQIFDDQPEKSRTGAIAAWAAEFSLVTALLEIDPRFNHQISYGHSRFGKSALLAAAFDGNIDGVISHQSGTGGASLTRDKPGETLADITAGYPFWFNRNFAAFAGQEEELQIDQHFLLGLIAPRPMLLGNAKRDVWSDPEGAFRAAMAATQIYELYGSGGLRQSKLTDFDPAADIAFWMRPGTHGVVQEDWPAFLNFLDAHFK